MISVTILKNRNNEYVGFNCLGHAEYARAGRDIICAGVSALVINTINSIEQLTSCSIVYDENQKDGMLNVSLPDGSSKEADLLIDSMILGLKGIIKGQGKAYVTLKIREV